MPADTFRELPPWDPSLVPQGSQGPHSSPTSSVSCYPAVDQGAEFGGGNTLVPATSNIRGSKRDQTFEIHACIDQNARHFLENSCIYPGSSGSDQESPPSDPQGRYVARSNGALTFITENLAPPKSVIANGFTPQGGYYQPDHTEHPSGGGEREGGWGKKRKRDDNEDDGLQRRDQGGDEQGGGAGGEGADGGNEPPRKVSKKTLVACEFCRGRKLKCDGMRPTCTSCSLRSLACTYHNGVRRRGPGRKTKMMAQKIQQEKESQQPQASSSTAPSAPAVYLSPPGATVSPVPQLPGPPMPSYPYSVGHIPSGVRIEAQPGTSSGGLQRLNRAQRGTCQTRRELREQPHHYGQTEQPYQQPWQVAATQYSQTEHPYVQGSGYVRDESSSSRGFWSREREEPVDRSNHEDDEGISGSQLMTRTSSSPTNIDPTGHH